MKCDDSQTPDINKEEKHALIKALQVSRNNKICEKELQASRHCDIYNAWIEAEWTPMGFANLPYPK